MGQTILTKEQQLALAVVGNSPLASIFYLTGGTALAEFYFQHRYSDDLDFFTNAKDFPQFEVEALAGNIKTAIGADIIEYRKLYDRRIFFFKKDSEELKIEFSFYPFVQIKTPEAKNGILIDSLDDMVANKFMALMDRAEVKDFADLYFIFRETNISTEKIRELVKRKFDFVLEAVTIGSEFAKARLFDKLPRMIKPLELAELKSFFAEKARSLSSDILE